MSRTDRITVWAMGSGIAAGALTLPFLAALWGLLIAVAVGFATQQILTRIENRRTAPEPLDRLHEASRK